MKKLITMLLLVFFTISVKAQCNLKTEKDQFTGDVTRSTKYELMCMAMSTGTLKFKVMEIILASPMDTSLTLFIDVNTGYLNCFNGDSKISINAGGTIINLNLSGNIKCGTRLYDYADFNSEDIKFLKQNPINAIRVYFSEGYADFNVKNKTDYFIKTLKCFE